MITLRDHQRREMMEIIKTENEYITATSDAETPLLWYPSENNDSYLVNALIAIAQARQVFRKES